MPPLPLSRDIASTVLRSATEGYYPDSDDIASAELTSQHLPTIIQALDSAKSSVQEELRRVSRANAGGVDSWISQARRLHADIEESKKVADEIVRLAEEEKALRDAVDDADAQRRFLRREIKFNDELAGVLGRLQLIGATLAAVDAAVARGEFDQAITILDGADQALVKLEGLEDIIVVGLMKEKARQLRKSLIDKVEEAWARMVNVNESNGTVELRMVMEGSDVEIESSAVIGALETLDLLQDKIDYFHQQLDKILIVPRLETQQGRIPMVEVHGNTLKVFGTDNDLSAVNLFADLRMMIQFLDSNLPPPVMSSLQRILVPNLTNRLISGRLSSSVPSTLDDLPSFEDLLRETKKFEDELHKTDWTKERQLSDWVERAPKVWLAKRRESALDTTRKILAQGIRKTEIAERSETRMVNAEDGKGAMVAGVAEVAGADDIDWGAEWGDGDEDPDPASTTNKEAEDNAMVRKSTELTKDQQSSQLLDDDDDDGADGWGLDEDLGLDDDEPPQAEKSPEPEKPAEEEEDDIDWGAWGADDDQSSSAAKHPSKIAPKQEPPPPAPKPLPQPQSKPAAQPSARRGSVTHKDVTLTETYTISSIPTALLELISLVLEEASLLSTDPRYTSSPISPAASGIRTIPTLILSIFRALAPLYYTTPFQGNMYLYNDSIRLHSQLPLLPSIPEKDISTTLTFGKRHYAKEMDTQRTLLCDYLDSAQGFVACTDIQQCTSCTSAISAALAQLRQLCTAWTPVLSKSALYQSIGSLINTVVTRLINDIEDLSDISEAESVALAGFCESIAGLEMEMLDGKAPLYVANWIKFRFLEEILKGSLADVRYMWEEGMLKEDFEVEEVVDLLKALFADSDMRRKAIDDIKHGKR